MTWRWLWASVFGERRLAAPGAGVSAAAVLVVNIATYTIKPTLLRTYPQYTTPIMSQSTSRVNPGGPIILPLSTIVQNVIQTLITANTVSIPEQEDPFDTAFNGTFAQNVKATINGQNKSRAELRDFLLQIRGSLNSETVQFTQLIEHQDKDGSERNGEVGAFFTWEGFRPFLVLGAPTAVKASVSLQATVRAASSGLYGHHITNVSVVAQEIPVPITLPGQPHNA